MTGMSHRSILTVELRDGVTGELKEKRTATNWKTYGTMNMLVSGVVNSTATQCAVFAGLGCSTSIACTDTTLGAGEVLSRTLARYSHDANSPSWNLSWSWTQDAKDSVQAAAIFTSYTGGVLYLIATFAALTKLSADQLYIAWLQSFASA